MANITFSESSGLNDTIYGKIQYPVRMFVEQRAEDFEQASQLDNLFAMGTSENFADLYTSQTEMSGFEPVGENGAYPSDGMQDGYSKLLVYETWKDSFAISQEMIEDAKLQDLRKQPNKFVRSFYRTREQFGAAQFAAHMSGNTSITFRGKVFDVSAADGLAVAATAHPSKVSGETQSNKFSDVLSEAALGAAETAMQNFCDDDGNVLAVAPDTILIPNDADMKKTVLAIIGADKEAMSANNAFNYQYGRWSVIIWSYLNQFLASGLKPWALIDSAYNKEYGGAIWNDRIPLTVKSGIDENTDANIWRGRARFNATANDWRFMCVGGLTGGTQLVSA